MTKAKFSSGEQAYDYIITGAGCAGLSLAVHMIESGGFAGKKILLIDKKEKNDNDRTWCFWETKPGLFESIVYKRWSEAWFHSHTISRKLGLSPYEYKLIRGIDFYNYCFAVISRQPNISIIYDHIISIHSEGNTGIVKTTAAQYQSNLVFNSILFEKPLLKEKDYYLLQHFKGWIIETEQACFDPAVATLMDFRVDQQHGTTFVYVMPFTEKKALVEYTLFTKNILQPYQYDEGLKNYINQFLKIENYHCVEEEFGVIPMTNFQFQEQQGNIINIGTAGGQTKASSGYTFSFIQKHSAAIVKQLLQHKHIFSSFPGKKRFHFYDSTLLHILQHDQLPGAEIFTHLFKKNKPQQVLRFLDNESSVIDELKIISTLPTLPFLKAALHQF